MLSEYIFKNYKSNEPIFSSDVKIAGFTSVNLRQQFKILCDKGVLNRFDNGIYYIPKITRLRGGVKMPSDIVAKYKYIENNGNVFGYYSGHTLANRIGVLNQVPMKEEIVSNNVAAIVREVKLGEQLYVLRHSKIRITKENQKTLQLLDLLKEFDLYNEVDEETCKLRIYEFIKRNKIARADVEKYVGCFPLKTYKAIFDLRLENAFA